MDNWVFLFLIEKGLITSALCQLNVFYSAQRRYEISNDLKRDGEDLFPSR